MVIVAHVLASTERTNNPATDSPRWSKFIFTAQKGHDEVLPLTSEHSCTYDLGYSHSTSGKQWAFISEHTYSVRSECDNHFTTPQGTQSLRALYCLRYATARTHSPHSPAIIRSSWWRCSATICRLQSESGAGAPRKMKVSCAFLLRRRRRWWFRQVAKSLQFSVKSLYVILMF